MKIALDAMGGDFAPQAAVDGAVLAAQKLAGKTQIVLIGQESAIRPLLDQHGYAATPAATRFTTAAELLASLPAPNGDARNTPTS